MSATKPKTKKTEVPKGFGLCFSATSKRSLSILNTSDVLELDRDEAVGLIDELNVLGIRTHLCREADLDARIGTNLVIAHRRAFDLLALHGHTLRHLLLAQCRAHALLDNRLVLKDLIDDIPRGQFLVILNFLGNSSLNLGERYGRVGAVLLGDFLDHTRDGVDDLLARYASVALQQAIGDKHTVLAGNLAFLVT